MKIPTGSSGNGYYGHDVNLELFIDNGEPETPPVVDNDFSEYMWMENEEEFDKQVCLQCYICLFVQDIVILHDEYLSHRCSSNWKRKN